MTSTDMPRPVIQIGVFAAKEGWLLSHPALQGRFEDRDEAMAAARRLAHLECWRGRRADVLVQEPLSAQLILARDA